MTIQKTTDYGKFRVLSGNRRLNLGHLARLTMSITKRNMLEQNPIMVNENMEVIDGQHRLEVARANNWTIYYVILPNTGISEVLELNTNVRNWKLTDYIDSLIVQGNKTMSYLKDFYTEFGLSPTAAMILHGYGQYRPEGNPIGRLNRIEFSEQQKKNAVLAADLLSTIREYKTKKGAFPHAMLSACLRMAQEGKAKQVGEAIRARGKVVAMSLDRNECYRILSQYVH